MKKILLYGLSFLLAATSSVSLTSCIDEVELTSGATLDDVNKNPNSGSALIMAIPRSLISVWNNDYAFSFGYGAFMRIRDVQTEDMVCDDGGVGYDWFAPWAQNEYMGRDYIYNQFIWNSMYENINAANNVIKAIDSTTTVEAQLGDMAAAKAYRAMFYLDLARCYEWLPNDQTQGTSPEGNDITGLTVPIVDENTAEEDARNNPRAKKDEMAAFILKDLQDAEKNIANLSSEDKTLPHLDCVYGLYARYYMWLENYPEAERYARMAIDASSTSPMTEAAALDPTTGFNTLSYWMWGAQYTSSSITNNLVNWTSWMSNEATFGYSGVARLYISAETYQRISDTDWRKLMWKAPSGSALAGKNTYIDAAFGATLGDYASLKFRPNQGDMATFLTGAASAYPLMRVEEMYLIEAEAAAHQDATRGAELLTNFMQTYRDPEYRCRVTAQDDVVEEIVFQKRIELWGEGQSFFDIKRLDYPVTRGYQGTNYLELQRLNTTTRPAWMNYTIVMTEETGNAAVMGYNNPDPTGLYTPWTGQ